jgi:hypothetical protein
VVGIVDLIPDLVDAVRSFIALAIVTRPLLSLLEQRA